MSGEQVQKAIDDLEKAARETLVILDKLLLGERGITKQIVIETREKLVMALVEFDPLCEKCQYHPCYCDLNVDVHYQKPRIPQDQGWYWKPKYNKCSDMCNGPHEYKYQAIDSAIAMLKF